MRCNWLHTCLPNRRNRIVPGYALCWDVAQSVESGGLISRVWREFESPHPDSSFLKPNWRNWQRVCFVIRRLSVRVRYSALRIKMEWFHNGLISHAHGFESHIRDMML